MGSIDTVVALDLYAPWALQPALVPAPSRLYRLPPQGLGTAQVESLTSYITRLAAVHTVSVRRLVVQELLPLLGRPHLGGAINNSLSAFWQRDSPALNGLGALARDWTQALERVTQWPALEPLTLRPWATVLPTHGLLRRTRAWCAACYAQWRQHGAVLYEPLQWHLRAVTVCAQHHQVLTERCPQDGCQRPQPPLDSRAQAGHCTFCGAWLGASDPPAAPTAVDLAWAVWVAQAVGALLAAGGQEGAGPAPQRAEVVSRLAARIDEQGGRTHCARVLGLPLSTICQWHRGTHLPQLGALLRLCAALGTTPLQVLTGRDAAPAHYTGVPPPHAQPARRPRPGAFPTAQIQQRLEEVLRAQEWPPPSMHQVARQLNYAHADLLRRFPTLCRAISARYLTYRSTEAAHKLHQLRDAVWQATHAVHAQGLYPSSCRVAQLLGTPSHFRHPLANAAWHDALRDLGWET